MSEKQQLIQAFKSLDFAALRNLLDDNRSYMEVPKELFLSRLEQKLKSEIEEGIDGYENVLEGVCGTCNKGCKAYSFTRKNYPSLNLFFEEKQDEITDIYTCDNIQVENPDDEGWDIYLSFYEEEKVGFKEDFTYLNNLQKIQKATEEFNLIASEAVPKVKDLIYWHNKYKPLANALDLGDPFIKETYKAYEKIDKIYFETSKLIEFYDKNNYAHEALREYRNINHEDEREVVYWLLTHKNNGLYDSFKKTNDWKKTGFIEIATNPRIVVDCSECIDAFLFVDLYKTLATELMYKYDPTREPYMHNPHELESFLRFHNKYLDIS